MFDFAGAVAKGIAGSLPKGRRLMDHAGDSEAHGDEEVEKVEEEEDTEEKEDDEEEKEEKETEDDEEAKVEEETEEVSEKKDDDDETKVDDTEDDEDSDDDSEDDESEEDQLPEVTAPLPPSTKATSVSANTYDATTASLRNEAAGFFGASPIYDDAMFDDSYWLFRNAGFGGDVVFGVELCVLASPDPDGDATTQYPYKKLLQQKLVSISPFTTFRLCDYPDSSCEGTAIPLPVTLTVYAYTSRPTYTFFVHDQGYTVMLRGNADDAALAFARGDVGKELGQETHGTNRGAPEGTSPHFPNPSSLFCRLSRVITHSHYERLTLSFLGISREHVRRGRAARRECHRRRFFRRARQKKRRQGSVTPDPGVDTHEARGTARVRGGEGDPGGRWGVVGRLLSSVIPL